MYDFKNMDPEEVKRVKAELKIIRKKERKRQLRKKQKLKRKSEKNSPPEQI